MRYKVLPDRRAEWAFSFAPSLLHINSVVVILRTLTFFSCGFILQLNFINNEVHWRRCYGLDGLCPRPASGSSSFWRH